MKAQLHSKSLQLLHRDGDMDQSAFSAGHALLDGGSQPLEEILESVRFFLEECDRLQGVHALVDVNSGFGGVGQAVLRELRDELGRVPILGVGIVEPEAVPEADSRHAQYVGYRAANEAVAMHALSEVCSLYVPVPLYSIAGARGHPYLAGDRWRARSLFHTAALAAVGLDTVTLPYRRARPSHGPNSAATLAELASRLAPRDDLRIAGLSMAFPMPFPEATPGQLAGMLASWPALDVPEGPLALQLSTGAAPLPRPRQGLERFRIFGSALAMRGVCPAGETMSALEGALEAYCERSPCRLSPCSLYAAHRTPFPITLAFPDILRNEILGSRGELDVHGGLGRAVPPVSVPVLAHLETSTRMGGVVRAAHEAVKRASPTLRFDFSKGPRGLDAEDWKEMEARLSEIREVYCEDLSDGTHAST